MLDQDRPRPSSSKPPSEKKKVEQEDNKMERPPPPTPWGSREPRPWRSRAPSEKNKVEQEEDKKTKQKEDTEKPGVKASVLRKQGDQLIFDTDEVNRSVRHYSHLDQRHQAAEV